MRTSDFHPALQRGKEDSTTVRPPDREQSNLSSETEEGKEGRKEETTATDDCDDVISALQDIGIHSLDIRMHALTHSAFSLHSRSENADLVEEEEEEEPLSLSLAPSLCPIHSTYRRGGTHLTHVISLTAGFIRRPLPAEKKKKKKKKERRRQRPFTSFRELEGELPRSPLERIINANKQSFPSSPLSIE